MKRGQRRAGNREAVSRGREALRDTKDAEVYAKRVGVMLLCWVN